MQMRVVAQVSVFAAVQLKSVLWSSYRAHARPPSCRVVHRYPLIVCHFGVECKFATVGFLVEGNGVQGNHR